MRVVIPNTTVGYDMVPIPAASSRWARPLQVPAPRLDEQPRHKVRVDALWMQAHEVTWDEYRLFMFEGRGGAAVAQDAAVTP